MGYPENKKLAKDINEVNTKCATDIKRNLEYARNVIQTMINKDLESIRKLLNQYS